MNESQIKALIDTCLNERDDLFLIDLNIGPNQAIKVIIDGDQGVGINDCIKVSRAIEHQLDRDTLDFSLEVTSAGATSPLIHERQYKQHVGRTLSVQTTTNEAYQAKMIKADDKGIVLEWKTREPKPVGKGKHTVVKRADVPYESIKEARVKVIF